MSDLANFNRSFELVISHEGGFTQDPRDPGNWTGGRIGNGQLKGTKYGISAASYPHLDIKSLTRDQVRPIYLNDFWRGWGAELLPIGCDYAHFDATVNHGPGNSVKFLQSAVGAAPDGIIGPDTRRKIARTPADAMLRDMLAHRIRFYMELDKLNDTFGLGWARRSVDVVLNAHEFIREASERPAPGLPIEEKGALELFIALAPIESTRRRVATALLADFAPRPGDVQ